MSTWEDVPRPHRRTCDSKLSWSPGFWVRREAAALKSREPGTGRTESWPEDPLFFWERLEFSLRTWAPGISPIHGAPLYLEVGLMICPNSAQWTFREFSDAFEELGIPRSTPRPIETRRRETLGHRWERGEKSCQDCGEEKNDCGNRLNNSQPPSPSSLMLYTIEFINANSCLRKSGFLNTYTCTNKIWDQSYWVRKIVKGWCSLPPPTLSSALCWFFFFYESCSRSPLFLGTRVTGMKAILNPVEIVCSVL